MGGVFMLSTDKNMSTETSVQRDSNYLTTMHEHMAIERIQNVAKDYDEFMVAAMEEFNEVAVACLGLSPGTEDGLALANEALVDNSLVNSLSTEGVKENLQNAWQSLTQREATFVEKMQGAIQGAFNTAGNGLTTIEAALRVFHTGAPKRFEGTRTVRTALASNLEHGTISHGFPKALSASMDTASNVLEAIVKHQLVLEGQKTFKFGKDAQNKILQENRKEFLDFFNALKQASDAHVKRTGPTLIQLANARLCGNFMFSMTMPTGEITDFGKGSAMAARSVISRFTFGIAREANLGADVELTFSEVMQVANDLNNYLVYVQRNLERMKRAKIGLMFDSVDMANMLGITGVQTVGWATSFATAKTPAHLYAAAGISWGGVGAVLLYQYIRSFNRLVAMRRKAVSTYVETAAGIIRYNNFIFREGARLLSVASK